MWIRRAQSERMEYLRAGSKFRQSQEWVTRKFFSFAPKILITGSRIFPTDKKRSFRKYDKKRTFPKIECLLQRFQDDPGYSEMTRKAVALYRTGQ
jgi:hypothetical protein